jgi:hypothetical protein
MSIHRLYTFFDLVTWRRFRFFIVNYKNPAASTLYSSKSCFYRAHSKLIRSFISLHYYIISPKCYTRTGFSLNKSRIISCRQHFQNSGELLHATYNKCYISNIRLNPAEKKLNHHHIFMQFKSLLFLLGLTRFICWLIFLYVL